MKACPSEGRYCSRRSGPRHGFPGRHRRVTGGFGFANGGPFGFWRQPQWLSQRRHVRRAGPSAQTHSAVHSWAAVARHGLPPAPSSARSSVSAMSAAAFRICLPDLITRRQVQWASTLDEAPLTSRGRFLWQLATGAGSSCSLAGSWRLRCGTVPHADSLDSARAFVRNDDRGEAGEGPRCEDATNVSKSEISNCWVRSEPVPSGHGVQCLSQRSCRVATEPGENPHLQVTDE